MYSLCFDPLNLTNTRPAVKLGSAPKKQKCA